VYTLARRHGRDRLLAEAMALDSGLSRGILADMLATLDRFTDDQLPAVTDPDRLRRFFADWRGALIRSGQP